MYYREPYLAKWLYSKTFKEYIFCSKDLKILKPFLDTNAETSSEALSCMFAS